MHKLVAAKVTNVSKLTKVGLLSALKSGHVGTQAGQFGGFFQHLLILCNPEQKIPLFSFPVGALKSRTAMFLVSSGCITHQGTGSTLCLVMGFFFFFFHAFKSWDDCVYWGALVIWKIMLIRKTFIPVRWGLVQLCAVRWARPSLQALFKPDLCRVKRWFAWGALCTAAPKHSLN